MTTPLKFNARQQSNETYVHQRCIDVIAGLAVNRNEERQAAVYSEDVHATVLIVVTREQTNAAVLRTNTRCHYIQSLRKKTWNTFKTEKQIALKHKAAHLGRNGTFIKKTNSTRTAGPTTTNANILVNWRSVITYV